MENTTVVVAPRMRFTYWIGSFMPRPLRIIFYILLCLTVVYLLFRLIEAALKLIQRVGYFVFNPRNYWTAVFCISICSLMILIASQFIFGLDPFGNFITWIENCMWNFKVWLVEVIIGTK